VLSGAVLWDRHRRVFCARHQAFGRHCRHCDRFFLPGAAASDTCGACAPTAVVDRRVAERVGEAAARWFAANGLALPPIDVRLREAMPSSPLLPGTRMLGYTEQPGGRVVVAAGLPLAVLQMVLAHEFGHVLIGRAGLRLATPVEEGACDWLAHRYLGALGTAEAAVQRQRIETRDDPVYGRGFRAVSQHLGQRPPRELLALLTGVMVPAAR
jgi:hypothetical protein